MIRPPQTQELTTAEMAQIFAALRAEPLYPQTFFLCCIVCGSRCAEIGALQWVDVEGSRDQTDDGQLAAPGLSLTIPQWPRMVLRRLHQLPRAGAQVFQPRRECGSFWSPQTAHLNWGRLRARAGLPGLKLNAVRYTWARWMARQDRHCRELELLLDRTTVQRYQAVQPPLPAKTVRMVGTLRQPLTLMRRRPACLSIKGEWPG